MKKIKNKWFYIYSAIIYLILSGVTLLLSSIYLEPNIKSFFVSQVSTSKFGSPNIIEVIVNDESTEKYSWPWPIYMYTEMLDYFSSYTKAKVIGFDIFLPTINPMNNADMNFLNQVNKMDNLVTGFLGSEENSQISKTQLETFKKIYSVEVNKEAKTLDTNYNTFSKLQPIYLNKAKNISSVEIERDSVSGNVFSGTNLIKIGEDYYPSLPLKMYLYENNTNKITIDDKYITIPKTGLKIPHNLILDGKVKTDIRYYPLRIVKKGDQYLVSAVSHYVVPADKIVDSYREIKAGKKPQIDPKLFDNMVILMGINTSGPSADVLKTPLQMRHPGVDIQATIYDNITNGHFLYNAGFWVKLLEIILLAGLTFYCIAKFRFIKSLLLILLSDIAFLTIAIIFATNGYLLGLCNPLSVQLVTLIFGYSFKFISENRNKEKIKSAMGKYLSQDIMKNVVKNIDDLKLGGKRAIVTVLFSDIRGFTSLSEKMSAEEVSLILNEYFSEMEPIITKYNGVINKFIGDAVMAIFGEPIQDINHPQNAVKCAYEMLKKVEYLREKWLYEGKPKIEIGVGINTGEVFIGNIGTETRMEYTVIGDTVNLASRIESYNKVYKTNLLVSSSTYSHIADIADVIKISEVQIRGKAKKMDIYEVLRIEQK
jgi:adenylate cyclase